MHVSRVGGEAALAPTPDHRNPQLTRAQTPWPKTANATVNALIDEVRAIKREPHASRQQSMQRA